MASVRLRGVHKSYGAGPVVMGVDLDVPAGARCVLLGPSGCGKTTSLRLVAGLESPDAGTVEIDGVVVAQGGAAAGVPPEKRGLAMVFQSYALWPHLSVAENVAYPLHRQGVAAGECATRVEQVLGMVHLNGMGSRMPHALSGGQQQRVALARALGARPKALLMDEPLSNLDARLRDELRVDIARICQEQKMTLLHVTHDQAEALSLATLVAVMLHGKMAQVGPPQEVYLRPQSLEVAMFLGDTRALQGRAGPPGTVDVGGVRCTVRQPQPLALGAPCVVAVRPEDVELCRAEDGIPGRVVLASCVGSAFVVDVETAAGTLRVTAPECPEVRAPVRVCLRGGHAFALGAVGAA